MQGLALQGCTIQKLEQIKKDIVSGYNYTAMSPNPFLTTKAP